MLSPVGAKQVFAACAALSGLISYVILTQGFGRSAAFTLGCVVARFQRSKKLNTYARQGAGNAYRRIAAAELDTHQSTNEFA
jgi:hypothetical protein